ncbi:fam-h protein [Plasmodium relictum]|uniref:Fam-h protein n=1 Tax=Plasmodium relictum TaxID=85471 RepID=A0A1J1GL71_PLARL|nr:fam-h protein [Plasmodium relictum]CRG85772.1 fam-h protein [Plasmodium relictum]
MNRKNNIIHISNFRIYSRYYFRVAKGFITSNMSTLKIYGKRKKINIIYFLIKFFIFTLLIWILQCSSNDSCRPWNYENDLKYVLNLAAKRSLTESKDKIIQNRVLKYYEQKSIMTTYLEQSNGQNKIKQNMNSEQENEIETKEKNKKAKFKEGIFKCKNLKLVTLFLVIFLSLSALIYSFVTEFIDISTKNIEILLFTTSFNNYYDFITRTN